MSTIFTGQAQQHHKVHKQQVFNKELNLKLRGNNFLKLSEFKQLKSFVRIEILKQKWHFKQQRMALKTYVHQSTISLFSRCLGWLAHLARHAPRNSRVKYAVGSNLIASINPLLITKLQIENAVYIWSNYACKVDWIQWCQELGA